MQMALPVPGNAAGRAGDRLIEGVLGGRGQVRAGGVHPVLRVAPEPVFAWLEALDQRVPGRGGVGAGVLRWRSVAAADVAALRAAAQMKPPSPAGVALGTPGPAGRGRNVDPLLCCHLLFSFSAPLRLGDAGIRANTG